MVGKFLEIFSCSLDIFSQDYHQHRILEAVQCRKTSLGIIIPHHHHHHRGLAASTNDLRTGNAQTDKFGNSPKDLQDYANLVNVLQQQVNLSETVIQRRTEGLTDFILFDQDAPLQRWWIAQVALWGRLLDSHQPSNTRHGHQKDYSPRLFVSYGDGGGDMQVSSMRTSFRRRKSLKNGLQGSHRQTPSAVLQNLIPPSLMLEGWPRFPRSLERPPPGPIVERPTGIAKLLPPPGGGRIQLFGAKEQASSSVLLRLNSLLGNALVNSAAATLPPTMVKGKTRKSIHPCPKCTTRENG